MTRLFFIFSFILLIASFTRQQMDETQNSPQHLKSDVKMGSDVSSSGTNISDQDVQSQ